MTNAPVKDVKALMNFVGAGGSLKKAGGMDQTGSFGDVMSKTQGGLANGQMLAAKSSKTMQAPAANITKSRRDVVNTQKTDMKQTAVREDMTPEQNQQAIREAGEEIAKEVAKELGVTEEEVAEAMEALGLSAIALLEPSNLTQLVLQLSGGQDQMALLTDENLFARLQELLTMASEVKNGLMERLDVDPGELQLMLDEMYGSYGEGKAGEAAAEIQASVSEEPVITVEVKAGDETVRLATDENGNVIKTVDAQTVSPDQQQNVSRENTGGQEKEGSERNKGGMEENLGSANPMPEVWNQNTGTAEVSFDQTVPFFSEQTRDIMDQIMDYMKLQLKPGMDQLEMQLHPESLGTVHVQLTSKGGEITAQFHVQNEAVKAALESQVSTLQETLKDQGVKVEAIQVTVESHGFESNLWQGQGKEENADASSRNGKKALRRINLNDLDVNGLTEEEAGEEERLAVSMMEANGSTVDYTA